MTRLPRRRVREPMMPERATQREFPRHRKFIRSLQCCIAICRSDSMGLRTECAHVRHETDGGAGLRPSDWWTLPLCFFHHAEQHAIGEPAFEKRYGINMKDIALGPARQSPDQDMRRIMRERWVL